MSLRALVSDFAVGLSAVKVATVTLTDAQIKALPTTPVTLVAAQGAGTMILPTHVVLAANFSAGAYTNINATHSYIYPAMQNEEVYGQPIRTKSADSQTDLDTFLAATRHLVISRIETGYPVGGTHIDLFPQPFSGVSLNVPFTLIGFNNGSGNFTGGDGDNVLQATTYYTVISPP